jgi:hypothetical protein
MLIIPETDRQDPREIAVFVCCAALPLTTPLTHCAQQGALQRRRGIGLPPSGFVLPDRSSPERAETGH